MQYNKAYDLEEYYERLQIFTDNKKRIDKHNAGNHSFTSETSLCLHICFLLCVSCENAFNCTSLLPAVALNQFSDMTFSEFRKSFLMSEPQVMPPVQEVVYSDD